MSKRPPKTPKIEPVKSGGGKAIKISPELYDDLTLLRAMHPDKTLGEILEERARKGMRDDEGTLAKMRSLRAAHKQ